MKYKKINKIRKFISGLNNYYRYFISAEGRDFGLEKHGNILGIRISMANHIRITYIRITLARIKLAVNKFILR